MKIRYILISLITFMAQTTFAQQEWDESGEIEDAQVIIEKDKKLELPRASRNYEKIPPLPVKNTSDNELTYDFKSFHLNPGTVNPRIRVFTIKEDPLNRLYGNYVQAGLGNYITPYLEVYSYNKRNDNYSFGGHFRHLSSMHGPVDKRNSGNSDNMASLSGKYFTEPLVFDGQVKYQRLKNYFYGYQPGSEVDRDTLRQVFNQISLEAGMEDNLEDALVSFGLKSRFNYLSDRFEAREMTFNLDGDLDYWLSEALSAKIKTNLILSNRKDSSSISRNLFNIRPSFVYSMMPLSVEGGFNVVFHNDTLSNKSQLNFYPFAKAKYYLTDQINVYAGIDGDMQVLTLNKLINENPYLTSDIPLFHTNKTFEFSGGIEGTLLSNLVFNTGFSFGNYKNMYHFVNNATDTTEFSVLYDFGNTGIFNFYGELDLFHSDNIRLNFRGDIYQYDTDEVAEAWHRPGYQLSFSGFYNLYEKITFNTDLYFIGGLKGYMLHNNQSFDLDNIIDLNLKIDYLFSDRFSAFLSFENILGQKYERFLNYPSRRMMVMAGIGYTF